VQLKWTRASLADLDAVEIYIAEDNSPAVALNIVLNILDTTESILPEHPEAGRPGREDETRELVIDGIPFIVIYQLADRVEILRVMHGAQQWPLVAK